MSAQEPSKVIHLFGGQDQVTYKIDNVNEAVQPITTEQPLVNSVNTPTREEFDAKLETIEARMDGRVASIEGKIDVLLVKMDEREKSAAERFGRIEESLTEIRSETKNFKWWLVALIVPTGIAVVFGVAAFNATVLSNMVASFESGKNTSTAQSEVRRQTEETAVLLKRIQDQINAVVPPKK